MDSTTELPGQRMIGREVTPQERRQYLDSLAPATRALALAYMIADPALGLCLPDNTFYSPVNATLRTLLDCTENTAKAYAGLLRQQNFTRTSGRGVRAKTWLVLNREQKREFDELLAKLGAEGVISEATGGKNQDTKLLGELAGAFKTEEGELSTAPLQKLFAVLPLGDPAQLRELLANLEHLRGVVDVIETYDEKTLRAVQDFIRGMITTHGAEKAQAIMQLLVQIVNAQKD